MTEPEGIEGLECPEGYAPGWLNAEGLPTSCVNNMPMPAPEPVVEPAEEIAPPVQDTVEAVAQPVAPMQVDAGHSEGVTEDLLWAAIFILAITVALHWIRD